MTVRTTQFKAGFHYAKAVAFLADLQKAGQDQGELGRISTAEACRGPGPGAAPRAKANGGNGRAQSPLRVQHGQARQHRHGHQLRRDRGVAQKAGTPLSELHHGVERYAHDWQLRDWLQVLRRVRSNENRPTMVSQCWTRSMGRSRASSVIRPSSASLIPLATWR